MPNSLGMRRLLVLVALLAGFGLVSAGDVRADCVRVHVWVNYESAPPQDVVNRCHETGFPTAFGVYRDTSQSGTVPPGSPNGAGVNISVALPEPTG